MTKVANFSTDHPYALIRGWVETGAAIGAGIGKVMQTYLNNTAGQLVYGDVVVIDSSADQAITTTTTAQDTRIVGIVQDTIEVGAIGPVITAGFAPYVNVTASVTRGYFAETSTTAKKATQNVDRRAGSFGVYLTAGTAPSCLLFGGGDSAGGTGSGGPGIASSLRTITPSQLTANTDNWNPTGLSTADVIRASTDASRNLTGIVAPAASRMIVLENIGSFDLVLIHDSTSTAANRFLCPDDNDLTLPPDSGVFLIYDETSDRWRAIGGTGGGAGGGASSNSYAETIGDTIATTFTINHALGTNDVVVLVYRTASPFDQVFPEVDLTDADNVDVVFTVAPGTDEYRVVVIAAGGTGSGTAFPGSPATGTRFYRSDLSMEFFYDGTRWLSTTLYSQPLQLADALLPAAANASLLRGSTWHNDYDLWLVSYHAFTFVVTTNDGTKFWTIALKRQPTNNNITSFTTAADTASTHTGHKGTIAALLGTGEVEMEATVTKTSTPGNLYLTMNVDYRIVGT